MRNNTEEETYLFGIKKQKINDASVVIILSVILLTFILLMVLDMWHYTAKN